MKSKLPITLCFFLFALSVKSQQLAFPTAEGYGRNTTGGRGGVVYEVTNLNDAGAGSFRDACSKTGTRTIVFRVSGTILLNSRITITNGNLTIAGQTAPGDGICIRGYDLYINANNVIIRYLRLRLGKDNVANCECDAFGGQGRNNIIIDHCSMSWSIDETGSFYDNTNFTMQWCILSESLYAGGHVKGNHGYGGIQGGMGATFHHNLYANHTSRNPRFCGARYHQSTSDLEIVDFRNNVIFNWGFNSVYGGEYGHQNIINNYYKSGPATRSGVRNRIVEIDRGSESDPGQFYIDGNYVVGYPSISANNWSGGVQGSDMNVAGVKALTPFSFATVTTQTAEDAYTSILNKVGANFPKRDTIDKRIISELQSGVCTYGDSWGANSGIIDNPSSVGGWPVLNSVVAPVDTDKDGMPDTWEIANNLNPNNASDRNTVGADGYTMLEKYINCLVGEGSCGNTFSLSTSTVGPGNITVDPAGTYYTPGTVVTLTANPTSGTFSGWSGDLTGTANPATITMNSDKSITATFLAPTMYTLNVTTAGSGSVITEPSGGSFVPGTVVTLIAEAAIGYKFSGWSGDITGTTYPLTITMNSEKNITATFTPISSAIKKIAYVTDPTSATYVNDTKILPALKTDPNFLITEIDGKLTGVDYGPYDMILISEVPASSAAGMASLEGINKPVLMMKVHTYKTGTGCWNWTTSTTAYGQNTSATNITVLDKKHPIFKGVNFVNENEVIMLSSVLASKGLTYMDPALFTSSTGGDVSSVSIVKGQPAQSCILQIKELTSIAGTVLPKNFIQIGINSTSYTNVTPDGVKIIINACYYLTETLHSIDYIFTGNGNWSNASNWRNNIIPPSTLASPDVIIINPTEGGQCTLDVTQHISAGATLIINPGKNFVVPDSFLMQ